MEEWNGIWKKIGMEWNVEWKKLCSMEYGKIVFHSIACPGQQSPDKYVKCDRLQLRIEPVT